MRSIVLLIVGLGLPVLAVAGDPLGDDLHWKSSGPLILPAERADDPCDAIKDPTVVLHDGKWHLFATIRSHKRTHQIEYLNFADWSSSVRLQTCDNLMLER